MRVLYIVGLLVGVMDVGEYDGFLRGIYYNVAKGGSYGGIQKLWNAVKESDSKPEGLKYVDVVEWLNNQNTHNVHVVPRKKFKREQIVVEFLNEQFEADLIDVQSLARFNGGVKYLLVVIDVFSRYLMVRPLLRKTGVLVAEAVRDIFVNERVCKTLKTDLGKEFMFKGFQEMLKEFRVYHMKAYNDTKACFAERVNKSLQEKMYRYMYEKMTDKYVDVLDDIVWGYNNTVHTSTGMKPIDVTEENALELYERVYMPVVEAKYQAVKKFKFSVGDYVRISHGKKVFARGYHEQWTEEVFKVVGRIKSVPPRYKVSDLLGEVILGSFYEAELMRCQYDAGGRFRVERVLFTKMVDGKKMAKVRWKGWPKAFDSFVLYSDVQGVGSEEKKKEE